jgi:hypothetical protein
MSLVVLKLVSKIMAATGLKKMNGGRKNTRQRRFEVS